jgi:aryl-alcohol dehydrogenase-like predicted oxidoreductase
MRRSRLGRRDFLKTLAGGAALGPVLGKRLLGEGRTAAFDPKGLPTAVLGKTGAVVPRIGVGLGSRFCAVEDPEKAQEILRAALDHGFYYWDTAYNYRQGDIVSEARLGEVLKSRRREVFLATKFEARTCDGVMRQLEESLKRLRTDYLDLYQVHLIESRADLDRLAARGGALEALRKVRDQKVTRFIGFTGHLDAEAMAEAARRFDFDTMLIALNHYEERRGDFEGGAIPAAADRNLGIMIIKAIRPRETVKDISPEDLLGYALTLRHVQAAVVGTDSLEVVRRNAAWLKGFRPLSPEKMSRLRVKLEPFLAGRRLPWMQAGYRDGESA